jgi:hypothetical protein
MTADEAQARLQDDALAQLLELGMSAARESHARLMASQDAKALADCALAFNRVSRSVRQTIALQAKVARARRQLERDDATEVRRDAEARAFRRKAQVKATVERLIWTEAEADDFGETQAERLIDHLDDLVSEDALYDGFADQPVETYIARICHDLGVAVPPPLGEMSQETTEEVSAADSPHGGLSAPPQSHRDSAPEGEPTGWRSSA